MCSSNNYDGNFKKEALNQNSNEPSLKSANLSRIISIKEKDLRGREIEIGKAKFSFLPCDQVSVRYLESLGINSEPYWELSNVTSPKEGENWEEVANRQLYFWNELYKEICVIAVEQSINEFLFFTTEEELALAEFYGSWILLNNAYTFTSLEGEKHVIAIVSLLINPSKNESVNPITYH